MQTYQSAYSESSFDRVVKWVVIALLFSFTLSAIAATSDTSDTLILSDPNTRYDINSAPQASGLYACPQSLNPEIMAKHKEPSPLEQLTILEQRDPHSFQTTTLPNFQKNNRYCMLIRFRNETDQRQWKLHFSNFFLQKIKIILLDGTSLQEYQSDWTAGVGTESINVLGRALSLTLEENKNYFMVVELTSRSLVAPPYVALMTKPGYQKWSSAMSDLYNLSIGIVIGLVLMALLCSVILKDMTFFWFGISSLFLFSIFAVRSHLGLFLIHGSEELPRWIWLYSKIEQMRAWAYCT